MENFLNLSAQSVIWCAAVLLLASYIRGFSGFGFTAVFLIGLSMTLPITEIVPLSIALEVLASAGQAGGVYREVDWRKLALLAVTGILGTPVGVYLLGVYPDAALRSLALIFILLASVWLLVSSRPAPRFSIRTYALAGFTVGVMNGVAALSGLALALFLSLSGERPVLMRATMILYLFLADIWAGGIMLVAGYYDPVTLCRVAAAVPLLAIGVWLGSRQFASARPETFRRAVLILLLALSILGLIVDLTGWG